ncbi:hypothetical protein DFQ28_000015 [Apophysomyces sp. BC1034]|nr:hypothetical protein DFQ30_005474 [Apophysomyces sp. BC1015]KAG0182775.1 hypothetical protein DFQ29_002187 [Apophysomyces sp. BC1021]KAG0194916.1 hypothetical protein DFQ28_000015 [Apophysomyces sp. BC1034]
MTFDFEERRGNLFDYISPSDCLAVCVSEDLRLQKGIAAVFRQRFGGIHQLQAQKKSVGQVAHLAIQKRHVFYLITRAKVYNKSSYADLEACMIELRNSCESLGVWSLVLPRELGAGLDGLQEKHIKDILFKAFHGWGGKMVMYDDGCTDTVD